MVRPPRYWRPGGWTETSFYDRLDGPRLGTMTTGLRSALFDLIGLLGFHRLTFVGAGLRFIGILQTFLEIPDAVGEIAHQSRNLAFAPEQEGHDHDQDQPVPHAKTAHRVFLLYGAMIPREAFDLRVFLCPTLISARCLG